MDRSPKDTEWTDPDNGKVYRFEFSGKLVSESRSNVHVYEDAARTGVAAVRIGEDWLLPTYGPPDGVGKLTDEAARELISRARKARNG